MKKVFLLLLIPILASTECWSQKPSDLKEELLQIYEGEWISVDQNTRSITTIIIRNNEGLTVQAFGSCLPNDCDFGVTELHMIGDSVDKESNVIPFDHCLAIWDMEYAKHIMKLQVQIGANPQLIVDSTVIFKDNSGRSNYHLSTLMRKVN